MINYFEEKKELYNCLLSYLENDEVMSDIIKQANSTKDELEHFLRLLSSISNNHHRGPGFKDKIEQIIYYYKQDIKRSFSNYELFNIFANNKSILLFLFQKSMLIVDDNINNYILCSDLEFTAFFLPEIRSFNSPEKIKEIEDAISKNDENVLKNFEEKRQIGENDSYVCALIRKDLIDEFISYVTQSNISLYSSIQHSIFETNPFLIENNCPLIEYAAFFGATQIFQYLRLREIKMRNKIFFYAIHSNDADMIHAIEEGGMKITDNKYEMLFKEAIICHHNQIASYLYNNFINEDRISKDMLIDWGFLNYNYSIIPDNLTQKDVFFYYCFYNCNNFVDINNKNERLGNILKKKNRYASTKGLYRHLADDNDIDVVYYLLCEQKNIKDSYFKACSKVTKMTIPPTIKTIGNYVFNDCISLKYISIPSSVTHIGNRAFCNCQELLEIIVPESVTSIGSGAFLGCSKLEKISLLGSITSIKKETFKECLALKKVIIPYSVTTIEKYAFYMCSSLTQFIIPLSVESIGEFSFGNCNSLSYVSIPCSVISIGAHAFSFCNSLKRIHVPSSVTFIGSNAFHYTTNIIKN